jgi:hypothetical protein
MFFLSLLSPRPFAWFRSTISGHAPEAAFLEKIKAIPGVSLVETQTITNMEM